tara:strand:- start:40197 stop:40976 length:780 start_codon:yes stop_codon:yes gene_type:complete
MEEVLNITLPTSWNELSDAQLRALAMVFFGGTVKTAIQADAAILGILMETGKLNFENNKAFNTLIDNVPMSEIKRQMGFIYEKTDRTTFIESLVLDLKRYYAPKPRLFNLTIEEFSFADDFYNRYRENPNVEFLHYLAAVLYVPGDPDVRPQFYAERLHTMAAKFKDAPLDFLLAAFLTFQGCRFEIETRYKWVFNKKQKQTKADAKKGNKRDYGFGKIILSMAGGKFGTHAETRQTRLHTFMETLNEDLSPKNRKGKR